MNNPDALGNRSMHRALDALLSRQASDSSSILTSIEMLREPALSSVWVLQVTSHQLRSQKETEKQAAAEEAKKQELAAKREVLLFPVSLCSLASSGCAL